MASKQKRVSWTQQMPGRGLEPVKTVRQGELYRSNRDGTVLVRPDDATGTLILMSKKVIR